MHSPQAPLIGVFADHRPLPPASPTGSARIFVGAHAAYLRCLAAAGALPVIVPLELTPEALRGVFDRLDGILLTGGGDIDPVHFGEAPHPTLDEVDPVRDAAELLVTRWAVEADLPLLGICRGHQVANVALGGDLYQDIPSQAAGALAHACGSPLPPNHPAHPVCILPESRLDAILGVSEALTNSRHHQAVRHPGDGLLVTASAPDGIVEATENPAARFFLTVQWHPENLSTGGGVIGPTTDMTPLFDAFVAAAAAYRQDGRAASTSA